MKKTIFFIALCSLLPPSPQKMYALDRQTENTIYKIALPCGITVAVIGGIGALYYFYKERTLKKFLENLIVEIYADHNQFTPKQTAVIIPEQRALARSIPSIKKDIMGYNAGKILCCGVAAIGAGVATFSGVKLWLYLKNRVDPDNLPDMINYADLTVEEIVSTLKKKLAIGSRMKDSIRQIKRDLFITQRLDQIITQKKNKLKALQAYNPPPRWLASGMSSQTKKRKIEKCQKFITENEARLTTKKERVKNNYDKLKATLQEIGAELREYTRIPPPGPVIELLTLEQQATFHDVDEHIQRYLDHDEEVMDNYLEQLKPTTAEILDRAGKILEALCDD